METAEFSFLPLLIVIGLAFLVPILLSQVKGFYIPVVIGEIVAGIIVGRSGLGLVEESQVLVILSELGFVYLMFLSGLEIDFSGLLGSAGKAKVKGLKAWLHNHLFLSVAMFILTAVLSGIIAYILQRVGLVEDPWIMSLIFATTSLGVVAPILKEKKLMRKAYGQLLLVSAIVADFASIMLISFFVTLRTEGPSTELLLILVLLAVFAAVYRITDLFQRHLPAQKFFSDLTSATTQIRLRGSFVLALMFTVLAHQLGIENILGAFLAGMIVSMLSDDDSSHLRQKLDAIGYGFFIPIFFVMVGVNFNFPALLQSRTIFYMVPVLVLCAYVVKLLPALLFRILYSWREALAAGMLLSSRLSLLIAISAVGLRMGLISDAINAAIILVAIVTCLTAPLLFNAIVPEYEDTREKVIIVGCRKFAEMLFSRLSERGLDAVLICTDINRNSRSGQKNEVTPVHYQEEMARELRKAGIEKAHTLVTMDDADENNLRLCRVARHLFGIDNLISWVHDPTGNAAFRSLDVRVINPVYSNLLITEGMVLNPKAFLPMEDVEEAMEVREVKLKDSGLIGTSLGQLDLPLEVEVLMILRQGDFVVPDTETVLRANDIITFAGSSEHMTATLRLLGEGKFSKGEDRMV